MKSESRDHICPRCGSYLPTVTVQVPVYEDKMVWDGIDINSIERGRVLDHYEEREEVAECVRCTGAY